MGDIKVADIMSTTNYEQFKRLAENRPVLSKRISKVLESIRKNGYIKGGCIIVNEHFEVIDGQARLEALKLLHLPVEYTISKGAGRKECIAFNAYSTPWTMKDYIESNAIYSEDYKRALLLIREFKKLKLNVVLNAINGTVWKNNKLIQEGGLECSSETYEKAHALLSYASEFTDTLDVIKGNKDRIYTAIMFCYGHPDIDNDKLLKKVKENIGRLNNTTDMRMVNRCLEEIYNYNNKKDYVYIDTDYQKYLEGKYSWYASKYGIRQRRDDLSAYQY